MFRTPSQLFSRRLLATAAKSVRSTLIKARAELLHYFEISIVLTMQDDLCNSIADANVEWSLVDINQ